MDVERGEHYDVLFRPLEYIRSRVGIIKVCGMREEYRARFEYIALVYFSLADQTKPGINKWRDGSGAAHPY